MATKPPTSYSIPAMLRQAWLASHGGSTLGPLGPLISGDRSSAERRAPLPSRGPLQAAVRTSKRNVTTGGMHRGEVQSLIGDELKRFYPFLHILGLVVEL